MASFQVFMQPKFDQEKAREAFAQFKTCGSIKPDAKHGATAAVRAQRDAS